MRGKALIWILLALLVNFGLMGMATLLSRERILPRDVNDAIPVNLVTLSPPRPPEQEKIREPEKPKPLERDDFTPDLVRPQLSGTDPDLDAVAIDMTGLIRGMSIEQEFVFEAYELDSPPTPVIRVPPVYPYRAREQGIEGVVRVKILVDADGSVGRVIIVDSRPENIFDDAVRGSVPQWKFSPGKIAGRSVTAWVVTNVKFEL